MKCQKPGPDCYDRSISPSRKRRSNPVTSSKSARGRSSTVLRNGYLKIGYQLWHKEKERSKDFNTAWIQTLPINSCTFEQFKDIQETMLLILSCKTMYCYRKLYQKVRLTPRVPRIVLKSNSPYGQQDLQNQDAEIDSKSYGETCNDTVDYRISGVPLSAVAAGYNTREQSQEVDREVREPQT